MTSRRSQMWAAMVALMCVVGPDVFGQSAPPQTAPPQSPPAQNPAVPNPSAPNPSAPNPSAQNPPAPNPSAQNPPSQTTAPRPAPPPRGMAPPVVLDDAGCSNATLNAAYGFTLSGQNYVNNMPWAFIGQFAGDGAGALKGTGTQSIKGSITRARFTGTYEVRPDCLGTATLNFGGGPAAVIDFVVVDDGREMHVIVADQGVIEFGTAKRVRSAPSASKPAPAKPALSRTTPRSR